MALVLTAIGVAIVAFLFLQRRSEAEAGGPVSFGGNIMTPGEDWKGKTSPGIVGKIEEWAGENGVDSRLVAAVIQTESGFDPDAENPADPSYGIMQITPLIARAFGGWRDEMGVQAIKGLDINLRAGTAFLRHLLNRYGNLESAVQAYNLGETKFDKGLRSPDYLRKVSAAYRAFGGNL